VQSIGVTDVTYHRGRSEFGGLKISQVKRTRDLELENRRLHRPSELRLSERRVCRVCRVLGQHRSTQRKRPRSHDDEERLTADIVELARQNGATMSGPMTSPGTAPMRGGVIACSMRSTSSRMNTSRSASTKAEVDQCQRCDVGSLHHARRPRACSFRQGPRVYRSGGAGADRSGRCQDRLHCSRQPLGEWLCRELYCKIAL
jgi:hypothetical protein